jgi:asparagine synthase (glutamine-hydrolysing)
MCGIAGVVRLDEGVVDRELVQQMTRMQARRGPDDEGTWFDNSVGFGHRRLAILDLSSAGHQPMVSPDGRFVLVFNGEIYNYLELGQELRTLGYRFRSSCDTEVILAAYDTWGDRCVDRFVGMWAFALWDTRERRLFCSRDPFGIKPLFYREKHGAFYFASDVRALLLTGPDAAEPDWSFLIRQLTPLRFERSEETSFTSIRAVLPGSNVIVSNGQVRHRRYWTFDLEEVRARYDYRRPTDTFRALFEESVRLHFRSDVPVGVCLSGGLDSSAIVGVASTSLDARLRTFSILYPNSEWSEEEFAREVNERYDCEVFQATPPGAEDFVDTLDAMIASHGEPDQGIGVYSQWKVMELAKGRVTVLLDGQGGDELLAGYPYYYETYIAYLLRTGHWFKAFTEYRAYRPFGRGDLGRAALKRALPVLGRAGLAIWGNRGRAELLRDLHPDLRAAGPGPAGAWDLSGGNVDDSTSTQFADPLAQHLHWTITRGLLQSLLYFEDRNSMAFSLEARVPFLDRRLVEFCLGLKPEDRLGNGFTKRILRDSLRDVLPPRVAARRDKKGYPTPLSAWLRGPLSKRIREVLLDPAAIGRKVLNTPVIEMKLEAHRRGEHDYSVEIFNWLALELWSRRFQSGRIDFAEDSVANTGMSLTATGPGWE